MLKKQTVVLGSLIVLLAAIAGCKQYYNGAFGLGTDDYAMVNEYHLEREKRLIEQDRKQAELAGERDAASERATNERRPATRPELPSETQETSTEPSGSSDAGSRGMGLTTSDSLGHSAFEQTPRYVSTEETTRPTEPRAERTRPPIDLYGGMSGERIPVSPLDSTGQIRRVSFTDEGGDFDVTVDAAGEHLIYSSTRHRETSDIYRQRIDGSAITQLTDDASNDVMPVLSPDGKTIAFASDRSGNWDLYLMDADGGPAVQLTRDRTHDIHPSFSPDGKQLATGSQDKTARVWSVEHGTLQQEFTGHTSWVNSVSFSPDGKQLAMGSHDKTAIIHLLVAGK
ncbi:MAG: TolB family protein [Phycisphaeraceae bacterium]